MQPDLTQTKRRAAQYFFIDGSFELTFGALCLLLAGYFYIQVVLPSSLFSFFLTILFVMLIFGGTIVTNRFVRRFKERITYPRTGYIVYHSPRKRNRGLRVILVLGLMAVMIDLLVDILTNREKSMLWIPTLTALFLGFLLAFIGYRSRLPRFYGIAFLVILIGASLSWFGYGDISGLMYFFGMISLILFLSGGLTLWSYLRRNPPSEEVGNES